MFVKRGGNALLIGGFICAAKCVEDVSGVCSKGGVDFVKNVNKFSENYLLI